LYLDGFNKVSLARRLFESGLSHPKASYFLLRGQKKVTKEKAARCRLLPVLLAFAEGCQKGLLSLWQRASSLKRPFGLFSAKAPVLGAANGIKTAHA
jgi:hypothetical protein